MKLSAIVLASASAMIGPEATAAPIMESTVIDIDPLLEDARELKTRSGKSEKIFSLLSLLPSSAEQFCKDVCAKFPGSYSNDAMLIVVAPTGKLYTGQALLKVFTTSATNPCLFTAQLDWSAPYGSGNLGGIIDYVGNSYGCTGVLRLQSGDPFYSTVELRLLRSGNFEMLFTSIPAIDGLIFEGKIAGTGPNIVGRIV